MSGILLVVPRREPPECDREFEMEDASAHLKMLRLRMAGIGVQLDAGWSEKLDGQLHLDRHTAECAYWHSGYHQALSDVLNLVSKSSPTSGTLDTSSPLLAAG